MRNEFLFYKTKEVVAIQIFDVVGASVERRVSIPNQKFRYERRLYSISKTDKFFAYRRIKRIMKLMELDIQNKWEKRMKGISHEDFR